MMETINTKVEKEFGNNEDYTNKKITPVAGVP